MMDAPLAASAGWVFVVPGTHSCSPTLSPPIPGVSIPLALIAGTAEHLKIALIKRQLRMGLTRLDVVDVQVFTLGKVVLIAAAELAPSIRGLQCIVSGPFPLRSLEEFRASDERIGLTPGASKAQEPKKESHGSHLGVCY